MESRSAHRPVGGSGSTLIFSTVGSSLSWNIRLLDSFYSFHVDRRRRSQTNDLIIYKASPTAAHVYFHLKSITLDYVLEDIFSYALPICPNNLRKRCFIPRCLLCFLCSMFTLYCSTCAFVTCLLIKRVHSHEQQGQQRVYNRLQLPLTNRVTANVLWRKAGVTFAKDEISCLQIPITQSLNSAPPS